MVNGVGVYIQWWKAWKTFPVLPWIKAASLYRKGDYRSAASHYESGLKRHGAHPAATCAHLDLAYCLFKTGKIKEAEDHLKHVTVVAPGMKEGYLRLVRVQIWSGQTSQATFTIRRALRKFSGDSDLVAALIFCVLENGGPRYLLAEAEDAYNALTDEQKENLKVATAAALLEIRKGRVAEGRQMLSRISNKPEAPIEALAGYAEILLNEGRTAYARQVLRRAQGVAPKHPRVLSLFALTYLKSGPFYNTDFAVQLSISACQNSQWLSPREMHVLAEAYYQAGDNAAALGIAVKAKDAGQGLLGAYRDSADLDKLIESLSSHVRS